jgi:shikimate kinase
MKNLFLIGFMGSGKSTIGRELSRLSGLSFVDTDDEIERRESQSISAIFKERGEAAFRMLERELLQELCEGGPYIIASGGGTACSEANLALMRSSGMVVYLRCSVQELYDWLSQHKADRPLLAGKDGETLKQWIEEELQKRSSFYEQADIIADTWHMSPEDLWLLIQQQMR